MSDNDKKGEFSYISPEVELRKALRVLVVEAVIVIAIIAFILGVLSYFGIFPIQKILSSFFKPESDRIQTSSIIQKTGSNANKPIGTASIIKVFKCPVDGSLCEKANQISYQGNPGLLLSAPQGSSIKPLSFFVLQSIPYKVESMKGFSQTFIYNNNCYTASYLFSSDTKLGSFGSGPFGPETEIAKAGSASFTIDSVSGNILIQLQKRSLDKPLQAKKESESCILAGKEKKDYGKYEILTSSYFN